MEEEIKSEFLRSGFSLSDEGQVLQQCLAFCINHSLSPSDLVSHWEVYYLNRQLSGFKVDYAHMNGFQSHIQTEQKENMIREESRLHIYSSNDVDIFSNTPVCPSEGPYIESDNIMAVSGTNKRSSVKGSSVNSNRLTPFGQRTKKFVVQLTFNPQDMENGKREDFEIQDDDFIRRVKPGERCSLQIYCSRPTSGCRFMYDKIEEKFVSLENRIRKHISAFAVSGLHGEPADASLASQKSIFAVGMVCCDGEGRLNKNSALLQGCLEHSGGQRVRLDLHNLVNFSLFPDRHNPSGHCLIVSKVIDFLPIFVPPITPSAKKQVMDKEYLPGSIIEKTKLLSLIIAAGPFTTSDNLLFEPLADLLAYASRKPPQLLILMGPFIDSEHPEVKKGAPSKSFDDIFNVEIITRLQDYVGFLGSAVRVVLLPATRDANHDYVYPQPAFEIFPHEEIKNQVQYSCLANPSMFGANEVTVGCNTVDILKQLSSEEISVMLPDVSSGDRLGRLASHVLSQRSFYPLYPPQSTSLGSISGSRSFGDISDPGYSTDASDLTPFVKVLSLAERSETGEPARCVCVNPGRLAKGIGGGTFAELLYDTSPDKTRALILRI
ncbi:unnamed protein product [Spirodela intermedia]|uniref:DNA polymerase alpha subunit B n=1 Tax=Spirodela intermedia TaxID=51605 RepID=A0A7I8J8T4_SPIIN|nr:unnamed protein product [Spirodela intermedia]CAA6666431.1 unnamed protein product [Spirodela intermedia]